MFNQIKTLNEVTNYPITQLVLSDSKFNTGFLNEHNNNEKIEITIIGKSDNSEDNLLK
jgi:hypothetical protein